MPIVIKDHDAQKKHAAHAPRRRPPPAQAADTQTGSRSGGDHPAEPGQPFKHTRVEGG